MPINNHRRADIPNPTHTQADEPIEADAENQSDSPGPVIELADLSTGADAEVNRLKSSITMLLAEINQIRSEHVKLASDYQKLTGELRDIKLVLAKVHAKELRAIEGRASWTQSLRELGERFRIAPNRRKDHQANKRMSSLLK